MDLRQMQAEELSKLISERNALVEQINTLTGDRDSLVESIRESDEFEDLRNQIAELTDELDAKVEAAVNEKLANVEGDGSETEALKEKVKEFDSTITPGVKYYKNLYGDDAAKEDLPKTARVKGVRKGGSGARRIRGFNVIVELNDEVKEFESFSQAAKYLDMDTATLQEGFFAKAGVEELKKVPDEVVFAVSWEETEEDESVSQHTANLKAYRTEPESDEDSDTE